MRTVRKPPALKIGDTIGVIAPASNIKPEMLAAGITELERLGFQVKQSESITACARYTAGSVARRAKELNEMLADPQVKAIIAARGGYGVMHLLEHIEPTAIEGEAKIVMGYSDISALLIALYQKCGWVTFHGPMVAKDFALGASHYDTDSFLGLLTQPSAWGEVDCKNTTVLWPGKAQGRLLGGCLPLVVSLLATPWELDTQDAILFLEDVSTKPYQLDRMLTQLRLAGKLSSLRGIIFGEMNDCLQHPAQGYRLEEVLSDLTAGLGIPVLFGLRSGHSEVDNLTLPLGVEVVLDCEVGRLTVIEAAVSGET